MEPTSGDVTGALAAIREGDEQAFGRLVQLVYHDLRRIARSQRRRRAVPAAPLETTALVHETYLRLVDQTRAGYRDRGHFFTAWAQAMRHVLVDEVRKDRAQNVCGPGRLGCFKGPWRGTCRCNSVKRCWWFARAGVSIGPLEIYYAENCDDPDEIIEHE